MQMEMIINTVKEVSSIYLSNKKCLFSKTRNIFFFILKNLCIHQPRILGWKFSPNEIDYQNQIESFIDKTDQGYQCIKCGYSSMRKFNLKKHVETHMETLGYQCPLCNKQCKTKNSLDVHNSTFHRGNKR